jgi:hypothetical protein
VPLLLPEPLVPLLASELPLLPEVPLLPLPLLLPAPLLLPLPELPALPPSGDDVLSELEQHTAARHTETHAAAGANDRRIIPTSRMSDA